MRSLFFIVALSTFLLSWNNLQEPRYENEYFIVLKGSPSLKTEFIAKNKDALDILAKKISDSGGAVLHKYLYAFVGLHVKITGDFLQSFSDENIKFISKNAVAYPNNIQEVSSWGIDRIDQRDLPLDQTYSILSTGQNTHSYVIDTGILSKHEEFEGRIGDGFSALAEDSSIEDCNGHGTHVSGTVVGSSVGVAIDSTVHPVRVFGCSGGTGWDVIIKAIDWVIEHHQKPAVINMSLGGGANQAIDQAVENAVQAGIVVVVAAGNSNADACQSSPARVPSAITVAASTSKDQRAAFSNWGNCVDIFAPGQNIISASHTGTQAYRSLSGTSMASPHIAGAVSLVLGLYPEWSPEQVANFLQEFATPDKIGAHHQSPNRLLYVKELGLLPIVNAGPDVIKRYPDNNVVLLGRASSPKGIITKTSWEQISGANVSLPTSNFDWQNELYLKDLPVGEFLFRLSAWDDRGFFASDEVTVIISDKNIEPIAEAGEAQKIKKDSSLFLDGTKSIARDGQIVSYFWQQISGPSEVRFEDSARSQTQVYDFIPGSYVFSLTVEDNEAGLSQDEVSIVINHPPTIIAGDDQKIFLPTTEVTLVAKAHDSDSHELRFLWAQEQGPHKAKIQNPYTLKTKITHLVPGEYVFRVYVADEMNDQSSDMIRVLVIDPNKAPKVDAGEDIVITLPKNSVTLNGSCIDSDGWCKEVSWSLKNRSLIANKESKLILTNLTVGEYQFVFSGTDNLGKSSSDEVLVRVLDEGSFALNSK